MAPPPTQTLTEWSEANVIVTQMAARPSPYRVATAAYQGGILDALGDPLIERVVVQASAQVGKTQMLLNAIGYFACRGAGVIMSVSATAKEAAKFSKTKLTPTIEASPALRSVFAKSKARSSSNTILEKEFVGGFVMMVGAESAAGLASTAARVLMIDEIDRYNSSAGDEGDPVDMAIKRTQTFHDKKVFLISTPTIEGRSRINAAYLEGDQRKFFVKCPKCQVEQTLTWANVHWDREPDKKTHLPATAHYQCGDHDEDGVISCGAKWTEADRKYAVSKGRWVATAPFRRTASFHLSELYSPFSSLEEVVTNYVEALGNTQRLKLWTNTTLGELWRQKGDAPDWEKVYARKDARRLSGTVPYWVGALTCGVDVQKTRLEASVWGWGRGMRSALIEHHIFEGSPNDPAVWQQLDGLLAKTWVGEDSREHVLLGTALDSNYEAPACYDYARRNVGRVFAVRGSPDDNRPMPVTGPVRLEKVQGAVNQWTVTGGWFKTETYAFLGLATPLDGDFPPGWIHLPVDVSDEFVRQLVSEEIRAEKSAGRVKYVWTPIRERNEALDCRTYARAMAYIKYLHLWTDESWDEMAPRTMKPTGTATTTGEDPTPPPSFTPRRTPWMSRYS